MPAPPFPLTPAQIRRIRPHFRSRTACRGWTTGRVLSGIIYVIRHGLRWRDARPPTLDGWKTTIFRPR
jgi:putative transposase